MAIPDAYVTNFKTLLQAARNQDLSLMECQDAATKQTVMAVCAMSQDAEGQFVCVPLAKLFDGNPYEELIPPTI